MEGHDQRPRWNDNLWLLLLSHCQLRTIYRLLFLSHQLHRVVYFPLLWINLIIRDVGVVPDFIMNHRLYLLRQLKFQLPLSLYRYELGRLTEIDTEISYCLGRNKLILKDNQLFQNGRSVLDTIVNCISLVYNMRGRSIRGEVMYGREFKILMMNGKLLYRDLGVLVPPIGLPSTEVMIDIDPPLILTRSGRIYLNRNNEVKLLPLEEPAIRLNPTVVTRSGKLYKLGRNDEWERVAPKRIKTDYFETYINHGWRIDRNGRAMRIRGNTDPIFDDYYMVDVGEYGTTGQVYYFRGFKR